MTVSKALVTALRDGDTNTLENINSDPLQIYHWKVQINNVLLHQGASINFGRGGY